MATFVLVHGAWHGGWCWRTVATALRAAGHEVFTPTLTGLGERAHLLSRDIGLETHIEDVVGVLRCEGLQDVVLCGHSYGGMVITGVADRESERIGALVYLDAFVPNDGEAAVDLMLPERRDGLLRTAREAGDGWRLPPTPAVDYGVTDPDDRAWVDGLCGPHPLACFEQQIRLSGAYRSVPRRTYILAANYNPSSFRAYATMAENDPAWTSLSLPCLHDAMVIMPEALTEMLLEHA